MRKDLNKYLKLPPQETRKKQEQTNAKTSRRQEII